jgi:hypothetical protein
MFDVRDSIVSPCMRLHLIADMDDLSAGPGTSLGYVEQVVKMDRWEPSKRSNLTFTAYSNTTRLRAEVPDLETGMAIVLMNAKGNDG